MNYLKHFPLRHGITIAAGLVIIAVVVIAVRALGDRAPPTPVVYLYLDRLNHWLGRRRAPSSGGAAPSPSSAA